MTDGAPASMRMALFRGGRQSEWDESTKATKCQLFSG